jgi:hypothetical protein
MHNRGSPFTGYLTAGDFTAAQDTPLHCEKAMNSLWQAGILALLEHSFDLTCDKPDPFS